VTCAQGKTITREAVERRLGGVGYGVTSFSELPAGTGDGKTGT
jgi:hypothetical protein